MPFPPFSSSSEFYIGIKLPKFKSPYEMDLGGNEFTPLDLFLPEFTPARGRVHEFPPDLPELN
jgi:hypothetical protein